MFLLPIGIAWGIIAVTNAITSAQIAAALAASSHLAFINATEQLSRQIGVIR